ncbi:glutamine synthetase beta-grasp domain-containing protein [Klebsiella pneumoniae]|nr:glutamine synthetase beta-grasp domain-containing protein [Klebsiella pneumoniae]
MSICAFTDTKGKEQHVTIPSHQVNAEFFEEGKMFDAFSIAGWKGINESGHGPDAGRVHRGH